MVGKLLVFVVVAWNALTVASEFDLLYSYHTSSKRIVVRVEMKL
jgi:hypothetical protein